MGFNPTFYASRPKLSEITIDSDLDMGGRKILQAQLGSPHVPETWETEEIDWGDVPASDPTPLSGKLDTTETWITLKTFEAPPGDSYKWRFTIVTSSLSLADFKITADSVEVHNVSGHEAGTLTFDALIPAGSTVTVQGYKHGYYQYDILAGSTVQNLGIVGGPKTFNLTGKWLALGLDMQGLAATVKIQGVEMPYSDYAKYFPLAPTELKIPGGWSPSQVRPVIEVYK